MWIFWSMNFLVGALVLGISIRGLLSPGWFLLLSNMGSILPVMSLVIIMSLMIA